MTTSKKELKRQILCFIIAGILATLTDFTIYLFFNPFIAYSVAKTLSFLLGSIVAFLLNKFITFKKYQHSVIEIRRFVVLYASTLVANVSANSLCIILIPILLSSIIAVPQQITIILAFLCATGVSTILNFLGQRLWVFKHVTT